MLKKNKVEHFKHGEIEIKLSPLAMLEGLEVTEPLKVPTSGDELTDELLYYSAPGRPQ